jgi:hypothetical protein
MRQRNLDNIEGATEMSKEALTLGNVKTYFEYLPESGDLRWTHNAPAKVRGKLCQAKNSTGHKYVKFQGRNYYVHRIAWLYTHGEWPNSVDHINGNPADNRISNLRSVDHATNIQNERKARANNQSGLLGVSLNGKNYKAEIRVDGVKINLGTFENPQLAHEAYIVAKRQMHEGNTL